MQDPFSLMSFSYPWRDYQARVLEELDDHLDDDHLHVVAAPGSGKTILGLEVMRRLGRPALILAPTLTIRNQWADRLVSMFLVGCEDRPDWISTNIRQPAHVTIITYQALHAAMTGDTRDELDEIDDETQEQVSETRPKVDVIGLLSTQNIGSLILDEAHHLRKEWWKALMQVKHEISDLNIVSLTATPPFDVGYQQWQKYEQLCGPIDTEISVPELVKHDNLCPHQDYVYFAFPTEYEAQKLEQFKGAMAEFLNQLCSNDGFMAMLGAHPWIGKTSEHVEEILTEPEFFSSMIVFFAYCGHMPPDYALDILGVSEKSIPTLSPHWMEVFLNGVLYQHAEMFTEHEQALETLRKDLRRIGAIERRKVVLDNSKEIQKLLASSLGKLEAIIDIAQAEVSHMGDDLRMVVLADYIRACDLPENERDEKPISKMGVVPIFETLRRKQIAGTRLGVLTGSMIFAPSDTQGMITEIASEMGIDHGHLRMVPLIHDPNYVRVDISGENKQRIVELMTALFSRGGITVLIGTQALLGEGWDAPSINSLILASYVGSYMLSNQMRGRAIRKDPQQPDKAANIWHLAAVDLESLQEKIRRMVTGQSDRQQVFDPFDDIKLDIGSDILKLRRRFRAFEGISAQEPLVIENGIKRLKLSRVGWNTQGVKDYNQRILHQAGDRAGLHDKWKRALVGSCPKPQIHEKLETNHVPEGFVYFDTLRHLLVNLVSGLVTALLVLMTGNPAIILLYLCPFIYYTLVPMLKSVYFRVKCGSLEKSLRQVSWAVLDTLIHMDVIRTNPQNLRVETASDTQGIYYCKLIGATAPERNAFLEAMSELMSPIDKPRYLVERRQNLIGRLAQVDYHAVPTIIGKNKKTATFFYKRWKRYVGDAALHYTREPEGRMMMLQARTKAYAATKQRKTDRKSSWE